MRVASIRLMVAVAAVGCVVAACTSASPMSGAGDPTPTVTTTVSESSDAPWQPETPDGYIPAPCLLGDDDCRTIVMIDPGYVPNGSNDTLVPPVLHRFLDEPVSPPFGPFDERVAP